MLLALAHVIVPVMPLRAEPTHQSEQVSQLLFGEKCDVLEINSKDWAKIICTYDGYTGWCKASQLKLVSKKEFRKVSKYLVASDNSKLICDPGEMWLPLGAELPGLKGGKIMLDIATGNFKGKKTVVPAEKPTPEAIKEIAMQYLYAPYQWGGRSRAGIDCSGFMQLVYKLCGIKIQRDASQQATQGTLVDFLQAAQTGDLAFFDDKDGRIIHVGMLLDSQTIIHASDSAGCVAIDRIDQGGIISVAKKKRTHSLRVVKRVV